MNEFFEHKHQKQIERGICFESVHQLIWCSFALGYAKDIFAILSLKKVLT